MEKATVILITLLVYKVILIFIGYIASRRTHDEADMFLGGRELGPVVAAISYAASSSSALSMLGMSGLAYSMGLGSIWIFAGSVMGHMVAWFFFAEKLQKISHKENTITVTDMFCNRVDAQYRKPLIIISSLIVVISFVFYVAAQFQGAGQLFASSFGMPLDRSIWIGGSIVVIYTMLGGFLAVSWTDTLQGMVMMVAALALPIVALYEIGGISAFITALQTVSTSDQLSLTSTNVGLSAAGFVFGGLFIGINAIGQPQLLTRMMALKDDKARKAARYYSTSWFILVFTGIYITGLAGHVLIPDLESAETVFFALTDAYFAPVIGAVMLAALLSAIMSTADSSLLVAASAVAHDLGLAKKHNALLISRLTIAAVAVAAILVAIYLSANIFALALYAWGGLGAAFGPLVIMILLGRRPKGPAVLASISSGFLISVVLHYHVLGAFMENVIPFGISLLILVIFGGKQRQDAAVKTTS